MNTENEDFDVADDSEEPSVTELFEIARKINEAMTVLARHAQTQYLNSGLSPEEFNQLNYRDDGSICPQIIDGQMQMMSHIPLKLSKRRIISPEEVLELYQNNHSLDEMCSILERSEKWVKKSLFRFGIGFSGDKARLRPEDIPYGWKEKQGRLYPDSSEQWVIESMERDLRDEKTSKEICKNLNNLKIKNKSRGPWIEPMLDRIIKDNKRLNRVLLK